MLQEFLHIIEVPVILYTVVLTVVMIFLHVFSKFDSKILPIRIGNKTVLLVFLIYMFLTVSFINVNVKFFPFLHAIMLSFLLLLTSISPKHKSNLLFFVTFTIALMPILVMIVSKHPLPLGDDSRFIGYAKAIFEEGRWTSYKYRENPYYQIFPIIPFLEYALALITGLSLEDIIPYYLSLKLCFIFAYLLYVYLIVKMFFDNQLEPLIAMLLLSITPPLALTTSTQVVHQAYALIISLATVYMMLRGFKTKQPSIPDTLVLFPLWVAGILAHATYVFIIFAFIAPIIMISNIRVSEKNHKEIARGTARRLLLLAVISLSYWIYTYILDAISRPAIDAMIRLADLFTGNLQQSLTRISPIWYTSESSVFFVSWALIPSFAVSYGLYVVMNRIIVKIFKLKGCRSLHGNLTIILGFIGLIALIINYFGRSIHWLYGQNFYWLYLLMLPLSVQSIMNLLRKLLSLMASLILVSLITFYAVQDPTLSANTYLDQIGWADRVSWRVSLGLFQYLNSSEVLIWMDPRLSVPLSSLRPEPLHGGVTFSHQVIAIVGMDSLGLRTTFKDPISTAWFVKYFGMNPIDVINSLDEYSVILSSERYVGIWRST